MLTHHVHQLPPELMDAFCNGNKSVTNTIRPFVFTYVGYFLNIRDAKKKVIYSDDVLAWMDAMPLGCSIWKAGH